MKQTNAGTTQPPSETHPWLGIDFGTVYCSAALAVDGEPSLVPVAGRPQCHVFPTLAYVPKNDAQILVCYEAEHHSESDPTRLIADFKFDIADDSPVLPGSEATRLDMVAAILRRIKTDAETANHGQRIVRAVITIPAYLDADKRMQSMSQAARAAGFEEVKLLAEPKAAAIFYAYRLAGVDFAEGELTLVYDLGGSTFAPTLMRRTAGDWELVETLGDRGVPCAGMRFDQRIIDHLKQEHPSLFPDAAFEQADPARAQERRRLLKKFCQQAKHSLSTAEEFRGLDPIEGKCEYVLTRTRFNQIIEDDLEVTLTRCDDLIKKRKKNGHEIDWKDLRRVLLVGGSCNIQRVREKLDAFLAQRDACHVHICSHDVQGGGIDPQFAVALGALCSVLGPPTRRFMDAATYQRFRQELMALLERGMELLTSPAGQLVRADHALLQKCRAKLLEDRFTIAIVGEFQGGKSTTFNTLCDGRLLSPVGIGSKTSGCRVSAHALKDPNEPERAVVEWRSQAELIAGFDESLLRHLQRLAPERFASCNAHLERFLNLEDSKHRWLLKNAVVAEMRQLQREKKNGADVAGREDICNFALLVAQLSGRDELKRLQAKTDYKPEDVADFVTFPKDWHSTLDSLISEADGRNAEDPDQMLPLRFGPNEVIFAFVKKISIFIQSDNLSRIGSVPIDLPGLFASRWDTAVATEGMSEADAILYLFEGNKTIKESDLAGLREIQKRGWGHKLFYGWNMRSQTIENSKLLVAASQKVLRNAGFKVSDTEFFLFHAPLALSSLQLKKLLQGRLDAVTVRRMTSNDDTAGVATERLKDQLIRNVKKALINLEPEPDTGEFSVTEAGVDYAYTQSGLPNLMSTIETFSTRNKAEFVLVSNGAQPIVAELKSVEGSLENIEREPSVQDGAFRSEFAEAESVLKKFEQDCDRALKDLEHDQPDNRLADDFCAQFESKRLKPITNAISARIKREVIDDWWLLAKSVFDKSQLEATVAAICRQEMERAFGEELTAWIETLKAGNHEIYNQEVRERVKRVQEHMQDYWSEVEGMNLNRLRGMGLRTLGGNIWYDLQTNKKLAGAQPEMQNVARAGALLVGGILTAVTGFIAFIFSNPAGWFTGLVGLIASVFWGHMADEWLAEKVASKVHGKLSEAWPRISQDVKSFLRSEFKDVREWYLNELRKISNEPMIELKARQAAAQIQRHQSCESRLQDAVNARHFRESRLLPLRQELEGFTRRCRQAVGGKS